MNVKIIKSIRFGKNSTSFEHWGNAHDLLNSFVHSCFCLKKNYDQIHVYTDAEGVSTLEKHADLSFLFIHLLPDQDDILDKVYCMSIQSEPFMYVDNDLFIHTPVDEHTRGKGVFILCENDKKASTYKTNIDFNLKAGKFYDYNTGLIGGSDFRFFSAYYTYFKNTLNTGKINSADFIFNSYCINLPGRIKISIAWKNHTHLQFLIGIKYKLINKPFVQIPHYQKKFREVRNYITEELSIAYKAPFQDSALSLPEPFTYTKETLLLFFQQNAAETAQLNVIVREQTKRKDISHRKKALLKDVYTLESVKYKLLNGKSTLTTLPEPSAEELTDLSSYTFKRSKNIKIFVAKWFWPEYQNTEEVKRNVLRNYTIEERELIMLLSYEHAYYRQFQMDVLDFLILENLKNENSTDQLYHRIFLFFSDQNLDEIQQEALALKIKNKIVFWYKIYVIKLCRKK